MVGGRVLGYNVVLLAEAWHGDAEEAVVGERLLVHAVNDHLVRPLDSYALLAHPSASHAQVSVEKHLSNSSNSHQARWSVITVVERRLLVFIAQTMHPARLTAGTKQPR